MHAESYIEYTVHSESSGDMAVNLAKGMPHPIPRQDKRSHKLNTDNLAVRTRCLPVLYQCAVHEAEFFCSKSWNFALFFRM